MRISLNINNKTDIFLQNKVEFKQFEYGGNGIFNINSEIKVIKGDGCDSNIFNNTKDKIVFIKFIHENSSCEIVYKALNAEKSGALALVFYFDEFLIPKKLNKILHSNWTEGIIFIY
jgi:hypothetical protein